MSADAVWLPRPAALLSECRKPGLAPFLEPACRACTGALVGSKLQIDRCTLPEARLDNMAAPVTKFTHFGGAGGERWE